jgi:hypothetical protein
MHLQGSDRLIWANFSTDTEKPISAGFYRLEAGKELVYPYDYNEMKIVLEGTIFFEYC